MIESDGVQENVDISELQRRLVRVRDPITVHRLHYLQDHIPDLGD